ncbi:hypothetical protein KIN20_035707 [Parelaphostrongylus tenuis]|uniref:Calponin-homology (CH) domain-containing protein n=1 Tax=Parelaphostrongylus tenuis TaxID=148309 RepID=A0AAD5RBU0_PARTN|nr:hypothetical protein KIN20_035707 [Parelaphostrongylus tenuis]
MKASADEVLWTDLMEKYQCSSKWNALLAWAQANLAEYPTISVSNFTSDWSDGRAFCALIHHFKPGMIVKFEVGALSLKG